jgi:hypothetical protein
MRVPRARRRERVNMAEQCEPTMQAAFTTAARMKPPFPPACGFQRKKRAWCEGFSRRPAAYHIGSPRPTRARLTTAMSGLLARGSLPHTAFPVAQWLEWRLAPR